MANGVNDVYGANADPRRSRDLAELIGAQVRQCWKNAVLGLAALAERPELASGAVNVEGAVYVEGWVAMCLSGLRESTRFMPIEHGWLELADGTVIDPTLPLTQTNALVDANLYYTGVRYPARDAIERAQAESLPLVYQSGGFGGFHNLAYRAAFDAAVRACGMPPVRS